ncbi:MAG: MFS transporter [Puniceicoccaceae bacterium]
MKFRGRFFFVLGTFSLSLLLYIDRTCISVAKDPIAASLGLSDNQMGWILSAFALGYALAQTPSGMLVDRFGARHVLAGVVTFWSVFTALTGLAWNFVSLITARFIFGVGEAGAFPGMARATFSWIPLRERGLVTGINFSGSRLGAAFAMPLMAWMLTVFGWRATFIILGVVGIFWAVAWYFLFRNLPEEHPRMSEDEKAYIIEHRQKLAEGAPPMKASHVMTSGNMWAAMLQYFCSNFTFFFCLTWLFPYIKNHYGLGVIEASWLTTVPLIGGACGNWFSGWLIDFIYRRGHWTLSRRLTAITGFALAAIGLIGSLQMDTAIGAVLLLTIAIFGADMTLSPSWSFCVDIGGKHAGAISGTMNMAGNIGAFVTSLAFPYLNTWFGSTEPFFYIGAGLNVVAITMWLYMNPQKPLGGS